MAGGYDYFYTLQEICVLLNLLPNTFRQIVREYGDIIAVREQVRKGRTVLGLPRADFENLRAIMEMRSKGASGEEIRRALREAGAVALPVAATEDETVVARDEPASARDEPLVARGEPGAAAYEPGAARDEPGATEDQAGGGVGGEGDYIDVTAGSRPAGLGAPRASQDNAGPGGDEGDSDDVRSFDYRTRFPVRAAREAAASLDGAAARRPLGGGRSVPLSKAPEPLPAERVLIEEIASLRKELKQMDERRKEERDKLMTALMRTQHELQSLRYEVGVSLTRRDRKKKKGFWAWLFE